MQNLFVVLSFIQKNLSYKPRFCLSNPLKNAVFSRFFACFVFKFYPYKPKQGKLFTPPTTLSGSFAKTPFFPYGVSAHIHCSTYIGLSGKLLRSFRCCSVCKQLTCISVSEHMEVDGLKSIDYF